MDPNSTNTSPETTEASPATPAAGSEPAAPTPDDADALEQPDSVDGAASTTTTTDGTASPPAATPPPRKAGGIKALLQRLNIYLLLFVFILLIAAGIIMVSYFQNAKKTGSTIKNQALTQSALNQLANSDSTVGDPNQVLNIESNAVFAGQVLVRSALEVAGSVQIGGAVSLQSLTVAGQTTFGQLQITKNLTVAGNAGIDGQETVSQGLQVNGTGSFNGDVSAPQITTNDLQLNGDLTLVHHIIAGGPLPSRENGPALGSGGTASVSGSDTAGTVSINTGSNPAAGCFATITFSTPYDSVPHVLITPVGTSAGGMAYYITHTTASFSICDAGQPPSGASFGFDYFVVD